MCRDQCAKQIHAFEQSKVMSLARIESDIGMVDRRRMWNKPGREQSMKPMIGKSIDQSMTIDAN